MAQRPFDQAMMLALEHHRAGRLSEAGRIYQQIIAQQPGHGHALHMLGVLERQMGRSAEAAELIGRAVRLLPPSPEMYVNWGGALLDKKDFDGAIRAFSEAARLGPNLAEAHCGLGAAHLNKGQREQVIAACQRAIQIKPNYAEAYNILAGALQARGRLDLAISAYANAIKHAPNFAPAYLNLGFALREKGKLAESIAHLRRAIQLHPGDAETHNQLGISLAFACELDQSIASFQTAIQLRPAFIEAMNHLGMALRRAQRLDEATTIFSKAIELSPTAAPCYVNLGNVFKDRGDIPSALEFFRGALAADATFELAQSNICYTIHFDLASTPRAILAEHRTWAKRFAEPSAKLIQPHETEQSSKGRLKIGYVSPDFRMHGIGRFLLPLLENHDKSKFEIHCYSDVRRPDAMTVKLKNYCELWHETTGLSDETLARLIRQDRIDILIDLTLHMEGSRLLAFAQKPATVQVTWLGYASTTGLSAVDYRISDPILDPPGAGDENYVEKTIRIPSYWCYAPIEHTPDVAPPPVLTRGQITFGCFNDFSKVSRDALNLWIRILHRVTGSTMVIHALPGSHRQRTVFSRRLAWNHLLALRRRIIFPSPQIWLTIEIDCWISETH